MTILADAAWYAFLIVWVAGALFSKRDVRKMPLGPKLLHGTVLGISVGLVFAKALRAGPLGWQILPGTVWIDRTGEVFQVAGIALAIWARLHIGRNWSGTITLKQEHTLVRTGPYAMVRHPIYTGLLLAILGKALTHGEAGGFVGFVLLLFEWKRKSLMEERLMLEQFGIEYKRYRMEVKGLIPGVW